MKGAAVGLQSRSTPTGATDTPALVNTGAFFLCRINKMTINQRRWTYVSVISAMLLFGYLLPGNNNDRIRTYAAMSAGGVAAIALTQKS